MATIPGRHRHWMAAFVGDVVLLRRMIDDDTPDEQINDDPPTVELTTAEFTATCADYGLNADGSGDGLPGVDA